MKFRQEIRDFGHGYILNYEKHLGKVVGLLSGMSLADNIGHWINLPSNEIIFYMINAAIWLGSLGYVVDCYRCSHYKSNKL